MKTSGSRLRRRRAEDAWHHVNRRKGVLERPLKRNITGSQMADETAQILLTIGQPCCPEADMGKPLARGG